MARKTAQGKLSVADSVTNRVQTSAAKPPRQPTELDSEGHTNAMAPSGVGLVLLDSLLQVLYANGEAVRIFAYPATPTTGRAPDPEVVKKIRVSLERWRPSSGRPALTEILSGRRRYVCRAFALDPESASICATSFQPRIAVLIERASRAFVELAQIGDQYHLTQRERQAMALLLHGLTSKQIAERMRISPNTVKAFLRLIMLRMGVSTRSGIVGKILANAV